MLGSRSDPKMVPAQFGWRPKLLYALLVLAFVELCLQAFYYYNAGDFLARRTAAPIFAPDPYTGYRPKPNLSYRHRTNEFDTMLYTNSQGFRVSARREEYSRAKDPAKFRILLLGPSFAFGWGVNYEDTFGAVFQRLLENGNFAPGKSIEVINAGVPALPAGAQLSWYRHVGKTYHPDLLIQITYGIMHASDSPATIYRPDREGYPIDPGQTAWDRVRNRLKQSAIVFYGWILWNRATIAFGGPQSRTVEGAGRPLTVETEFDPHSPAFAETQRFYQELRQASDARVLNVFVPLSYCVHQRDVGRWRHLNVTDIAGQIDFNKRACGYLDRTGIACVDTTDALIADARQNGSRLYYWLDIHWTPRGNEVAARTVAERLMARPPTGAGP